MRDADGFHRWQWGVTDDKSEFTYSWRQRLPIVASSDRHIIENLCVSVCLRQPAIGFAFRRGGRVGLWLILHSCLL
jgi:hypothetical protein